MIMKVTLQQTERLLLEKHVFSQLGFSMLLMRLKSVYLKNPTADTLNDCMGEINTFIQKFEAMMSNDIAKINELQ